MKILLVMKDLVMSSLIRETAAALSAEIQYARSAEEYRSKLPLLQPDLVIVDLTFRSEDPIAIVTQKLDFSPARIIAFGPHVEEALTARAQQAGLTEVLTKGQFVNSLPKLLGLGTATRL